MTTLAPSIFYLIFFILVGHQDMHISLDFDQIPALTTELAALELLKNIVSPGVLSHFNPCR